MKKTLFALLALGFVASASASDVNLTVNKSVEFVPTNAHVTAAPSEKATWQQTEWFDSWTADFNGPLWYTPEKTAFNSGDTMSVVVFIHLEGPTANFSRIDAFYAPTCNVSNPLAYTATGGIVDFGSLPQNQPNYGWITGVGYTLPNAPTVNIESASRVLWNGTIDCGLPVSSARPDCVTLN